MTDAHYLDADTAAEQPTLTPETWAEKAERLARELKAARYDPFTSSPKQRERYAHARYAMHCHIQNVPDEGEE